MHRATLRGCLQRKVSTADNGLDFAPVPMTSVPLPIPSLSNFLSNLFPCTSNATDGDQLGHDLFNWILVSSLM